jgi:hypothetical protein
MAKWSKWPGGQLDLRPCPGGRDGYETGVCKHPTYGFLLQNAKNVTMRNCGVSWSGEKPDYFKDALLAENIQGLLLEGFRGEGF